MFKRNEQCFCESGKKYKNCCGNVTLTKTDLNKVITFQHHEIMELMKSSTIKECLHPEKYNCKKLIKGAHSIQKERILRGLAVDGQVFQIDVNSNPDSSRMIMNKKGIVKQASRFYGFCEYHDNMFREIESVDNIFSSTKQHFLFAYRALAQSYHTAKEMYKFNVNVVKNEPLIVHSYRFQQDTINKKLRRSEFERYKLILDRALLDENYEEIETIKLVVNQRSHVAVSSCFTLQYDIEGKLLIFKDKRAKIMLTVCSENNQTIALFSWIKSDQSILKEFKEQIKNLNRDQVISLINNLIPLYCENYFISPRLWNNLTEEAKEELLLINEGNDLTFALRTNLLRSTNYNFFNDYLRVLSKAETQK
ncbi:SEC-C domain-containing protein [Paenibacillus glycanilyticus]|uniref:SEC-C domain-containing protein n=1 Tax=Paenibacillus glycanilyticus TaxID=126569 RepID=UPI001910FB19|nr:SEC-C domain-containing protein [Paenibacillus glycanilyticus]